MKNLHRASIAAALLACVALTASRPPQAPETKPETSMQLGAFSSSLSVKDIAASRAFYEKLGFKVTAGNQDQKWLVLRSGTTTIGIFQGMFEGNLLTFCPGWNSAAEPLESFDDVRELQARLQDAGIELTTEADPDSTGPASFTLQDPDGNVLLFDQHVPKPGQ